MYNRLTSEEEDIIEGKGTEAPFTGEYDDFYQQAVSVAEKLRL